MGDMHRGPLHISPSLVSVTRICLALLPTSSYHLDLLQCRSMMRLFASIKSMLTSTDTADTATKVSEHVVRSASWVCHLGTFTYSSCVSGSHY